MKVITFQFTVETPDDRLSEIELEKLFNQNLSFLGRNTTANNFTISPVRWTDCHRTNK